MTELFVNITVRPTVAGWPLAEFVYDSDEGFLWKIYACNKGKWEQLAVYLHYPTDQEIAEALAAKYNSD